MSERMKALVMDAPGPASGLELRQLPVPQPGEGQARIKVAYSAVKPIDSFARGGTLDFLPVPWPLVPGMEFSGVVEDVGPGVDRGLIGRRVSNIADFGGFGEFALADASRLIPLADEIDFKTGAVVFSPVHTAYQFLKYGGRLQSGETVLVHSAAGAVGLVLTQMAKEKGARVIGLAVGRDKLDFAKPFGADALIDYTKDDWPERVKRATGGRGADLIVDLNGGPHALRNFDAVAANGRVYIIGVTAGAAPDAFSFSTLFGKSAAVGTFAAFPPSAEDLDDILAGLRSKRWTVPITEEAPLEQGAALMARFDSRRTMGRVVIRVGGAFA